MPVGVTTCALTMEIAAKTSTRNALTSLPIGALDLPDLRAVGKTYMNTLHDGHHRGTKPRKDQSVFFQQHTMLTIYEHQLLVNFNG